MNTALVDILNSLGSNPILVLDLYKEIFESLFLALVRKGTENNPLGLMEFGIYDSADGVKEFPLFTHEKLIPEKLLLNNTPVNVSGQSFWAHAYLLTKKTGVQIAINPTDLHGIRLKKEMILGMIGQYGNMETAFDGLNGMW